MDLWRAGQQVWSVTNNGNFGQSSVTFLQPFVSYATPTGTSITLNTEAAYNWNSEQRAVPINLSVAQILKIGGKPVQIGGGLRYWAGSPDDGPTGLGAPRRHLPVPQGVMIG